jgi:hypothetical protein
MQVFSIAESCTELEAYTSYTYGRKELQGLEDIRRSSKLC